MPKTVQVWEWEEAFQKHGFNNGDDEQHTYDVMAALERLDWTYRYSSGIHNTTIDSITKGDVTIEFMGDEESSEIRKMLPDEVVAALDEEFNPPKPFRAIVTPLSGDYENGVRLVTELLSDGSKAWNVELQPNFSDERITIRCASEGGARFLYEWASSSANVVGIEVD